MDSSTFNSSSLLASFTTNSPTEEYRCGVQPSLSEDLGLPPFLDKIQAVLAMLTGITAILVHSLLVLLLYKYPSLRHHSLLLALPLVVTGLVRSVLVTPVVFISGISGAWLSDSVLCEITGYVHDGTTSFRLLLTGVVGVDRVLATFAPRLYRRYQSLAGYCFSVVALVLSVLYVVGGMDAAMGCYTYLPALKSCTIFVECPGCLAYGYSWIGVTLVVGIALPTMLYVFMFCKTRKQSTRNTGRELEGESDTLKSLKHTNKIMMLFLISATLWLPSTFLYLYRVSTWVPSPVVYILQVVIGYPLGYLVPVVDGVALLCHRDIKDRRRHFFSRFTVGKWWVFGGAATRNRGVALIQNQARLDEGGDGEDDAQLDHARRVVTWHSSPFPRHTRLSPVAEVSEEGLSDT